MIIGVDYSINSPGVCVLGNNGIHFGTLARNGICTDDFKNILNDLRVFTWDHNRYNAVGNTVDDSQGFTNDSILQAQALASMVVSMNDQNIDAENTCVFEGFSFGSTGNRLAQLAGYQYIARATLINHNIIDADDLYVYAPQSVKSVAGAAKRGAGKVGMIQRFIEHEDKLPGLEEHPFYIEVCRNEESILRKKPTKRKPIGNWTKPVDDIIDAYWILYTYLKKQDIKRMFF